MGKLAITNGVFDVLHPGHFNLLMYCRHLVGESGQVMVLIDHESKVHKDKGEDRPIFNIRERIKALESLEAYPGRHIVDQCLVFYSDEQLDQTIKMIKPDFLVKGSDWKDKKVIGGEYAKAVMFFDRIEYSSTSIIDRIKKGPEWRTLSQR